MSFITEIIIIVYCYIVLNNLWHYLISKIKKDALSTEDIQIEQVKNDLEKALRKNPKIADGWVKGLIKIIVLRQSKTPPEKPDEHIKVIYDKNGIPIRVERGLPD